MTISVTTTVTVSAALVPKRDSRVTIVLTIAKMSTPRRRKHAPDDERADGREEGSGDACDDGRRRIDRPGHALLVDDDAGAVRRGAAENDDEVPGDDEESGRPNGEKGGSDEGTHGASPIERYGGGVKGNKLGRLAIFLMLTDVSAMSRNHESQARCRETDGVDGGEFVAKPHLPAR
ncbi:MAG: hypothetical protein K2X36_04540 [Microbacteriaceae bacterium]|nr:hypothetical protein [Microbacteriaceae bacterium]